MFNATVVNFPIAIMLLPVKSPNLEIKVSMKTDDLYLSSFFNELKIISLVGLLIAYSNTLRII